MVNIMSQWQNPEILISCYKSILRKIRSHAALLAKFRSDISARFRDIAEKQVPAKLKPIEVPAENPRTDSISLQPTFSTWPVTVQCS